ncbi:hypothetical protein L1987_81284 [Smallanthus sonchifolius]|uniref:Uncharacterized protein n=1 Tax=Smallanthus sonchifolius TaxID=185202 RepID=A0ACB8YPA5_9ASTR|nr:hypothetical protein L1987_81284 [Smallanthus sonchifolius]
MICLFVLCNMLAISKLASSDHIGLVILIVTAVISILWLVRMLKSHNSTTNPSLPPGPKGLPIVGNLLSLDSELHSQFANLAKTYGPIMTLWLGKKVTIVISSPALAREVLKFHDTTFANRDITTASKVSSYGGNDIVWLPYGDQWRMLRKILMDEDRIGFGIEFRKVVNEITRLLVAPNLSDFYPGLAWFDLQGIEKGMMAAGKKIDGIFDRIIDQRREIGSAKNKDFLQFLLDLKEDGDSKTTLTMTYIKSLLIVLSISLSFVVIQGVMSNPINMFIGGTETTSRAIEFALAHMIDKPDILKKAQQELDSTVGEGNIVEESHIKDLPYLHAIMKEVLRLHPSLPLLFPHSPSESCVIGGYTVPKGARVCECMGNTQRPCGLGKPFGVSPRKVFGSQVGL